MCAAVAQKGVWGVAPSGVRAAAPHSAPARTPGVYAQRLYARTHTSGRTKSVQDAPTTSDHNCTDAEPTKHTQPFTTGKGFGVSARMPRQNAQRLYARTHTSGRTKSVQDAPTTNDHDCRDAKPTKRSYRDREFALFL